MNWHRGLFRLWVISTALWILIRIVAAISRVGQLTGGHYAFFDLIGVPALFAVALLGFLWIKAGFEENSN